MRFVVCVAALGVLTLLATLPARALTISNVDADPHKITVTAGSDSKELTVEPEKEVEVPCASGCKVKLENDEEYDLDGGEAVSIEDGIIFIDHAPELDEEDIPDIDPDAVPGEAAPE